MSPRKVTQMQGFDGPEEDMDQEPAPARPDAFAGLRREPLLPEAGAGGGSLTAVIAVMSFLAVLAMAAVLIIHQSASNWTRALQSEITVQVKGPDAASIAEDAAAAMRVLNDTDGVIEATLRDAQETAALLDPWLGRGNAAAFLNIPAIIEVRATPALKDNLDLLRNRLAAAAPGAVLDDHAQWHQRLAAAARAGQALSLVVFILVMGAASAIAVFAARAGLAANHEIVSVLHLVGATDAFIAAEVQRRFFVLGLRGSLAGLAAALLALGLAGAALRAGVAPENFTPNVAVSWPLLLWLLAAPLGACFITALTARLTVLKALRDQY